jgi:hypothetical protein
LLVLCLASLLGSHYWSAQQQASLARSQNERSMQAATTSAGTAELQYLQSHIVRFQQLVQLGMVGQPDREAWVLELQASHRRAALPGPLQWTLHAPELLATSDAGAATPTHDSQAQAHELEFSLSGVQEEEVLALLQDFGARVKARMRVDSCSFDQPTPEGLSAHCSLRFFTLTGTAGHPSAPAPHAATAPALRPILGPLLYTRQERAAIVQARASTGADSGSRHMQVLGMVRRERAKGTAWINGKAVAEGQSLSPAKHTRITPAGVAIDGQLVRIGETLDLQSQKRSDLLAPGAVSVREQP